MMADELITLTTASAILGVNKRRVSILVRRGELLIIGEDPLDRRAKLVRRSDVEAILARSAKKRGGVDNATPR
jgi:hypothetical protein